MLGEIATQLVHRCAVPVLVARERPLASGVVAATRAWPADRAALTAGTHIAARLGAELTVVHVPERDDDQRRAELHAELANARALLGREIDYYQESGPAARAIVDAARGRRRRARRRRQRPAAAGCRRSRASASAWRTWRRAPCS